MFVGVVMSLYISGCMSLYMSPWMQTLAAMRNPLHPFGSLDARSEKECVSYIVCRVRQHKTQQPKLSGWQKEEGGGGGFHSVSLACLHDAVFSR